MKTVINSCFLALAACVAGLLAFTSSTAVAYAVVRPGTQIGGQIEGDLVLTKDKSPYYLTADIFIAAGHMLTIEPGASVYADQSDLNAGINVTGGGLVMNGLADDRITIGAISRIFVANGTVTVSNADMSAQGIDLQLYSSKAMISDSAFSSSTGTAIYSWKSSVDISHSRISGNAYAGIMVLSDDTNQSALSIHDSAITDNAQYSIINKDSAAVLAENNWWGSANGPASTGMNRVAGAVSDSPWLTAPPEPDPSPSAPPCCSSILFIPGLEGTRLYEPESLPLQIGTVVDRLWEPDSNADVRKLYLNADGSSKDASIYSGEPIGSALGFYGVYGKFMRFLDGLVAAGDVNEWKAFGYDWRQPIAEVVAGSGRKKAVTDPVSNAGTKAGAAEPSLVDIVSHMASSSKTGKVTLIAHSNGGLVAKYLVKTLVDLGEAGLIDSVISVAVPYLGTPEAIAGLLHGDHQSIAYGLIDSQATARGLGANMASAYPLLPSAGFFSTMFGPTIAFASTTVAGVNDGSYPREIASAADQSAFIADSKGVRTAPTFADTSLPIKGNAALLSAAGALHGLLDPMVWPEEIARFAIVGWNADTTRLVSYRNASVCGISVLSFVICGVRTAHDIVTTLLGDGTVVAPSAAYNPGQALSLDLQSASRDEGGDFSHVNILESSTTQAMVKSLITGNESGAASAPSSAGQNPAGSSSDGFAAGSSALEKIAGMKGVTVGVPGQIAEPLELRISTHSPVDLHVYDGKRNHTGPVAVPADLSGTDSYYIGAFERKIPDSDYRVYDAGDGQDTYVTVRDPGTGFRVVAEGTDLGFATLDIEKVRGAQVLESVEYSQFPVTPLAAAGLDLPAGLLDPSQGAFGLELPATMRLTVDLEGDGKADLDLPQNPGALPDQASASRPTLALVEALAGSDPHAEQIVQRLRHLQDLQAKGKLKQVAKQGTSFDFHVGHLKLADVSPETRQKLLDTVEAMVTETEQAQQ